MPAPKRGTTNVCLVSPLLDTGAPPFFAASTVRGVSRGLLNVQRGLPSVGSQAGLILVIAVRGISDASRRREERTFEPDFVCAVQVLVDDELGGRVVEQS